MGVDNFLREQTDSMMVFTLDNLKIFSKIKETEFTRSHPQKIAVIYVMTVLRVGEDRRCLNKIPTNTELFQIQQQRKKTKKYKELKNSKVNT